MNLADFVASLTIVLTLLSPSAGSQAPAQTAQPTNRIVLPDVTVIAQKEPANAQKLPISVTAVTADVLGRSGASIVSDVAGRAPNVVFTEFTARKLSNARFRGVGASPANPAVTTMFDGVPQLNANTSSVTLLDVDQIEFVRGPQSALYGRNTLGGLVNVMSARPSLTAWTGQAFGAIGEYGAVDMRGSVSGPLTSTLGLAVALGHDERDGFSHNLTLDRTVDSRSARFGKAQLLWAPNGRWETRLIVSGERSRDGDYALGDLGMIRSDPFRVFRDFEGRQDRDVASSTLVARYAASRVSVTSTSGFVRWKTQDVTDLDYSPGPLITRDNTEEADQFSQEVRLASAAPVRLSDNTMLSWQAGVFGFRQDYEQNAFNTYAPFLISQQLPFSISEYKPQGTIKESGLAAFGHATMTFSDRVDLTLGARADREKKTADLLSFYEPAIAPPNQVDAERNWTNVSPSAALAYRTSGGQMFYASTSRGFKAGGFNPAAPPTATIYDEEQTWNIEAGIKSTWAGGRVRTNAAVFSTDWTDLQLNLPIPGAPGQFYIANVAEATSRGFELEVAARAGDGVDLFATFGSNRARFSDGSVSSGADVSDKKVPFTPDYTASAGVDVSRAVYGNVRGFGRAEVVFYGAFQYNDANTAGQEAYSLVNMRAGISLRRFSLEGYIRNAFDTKYIPVAFEFPGLAPSGFMAEPGRPRTFGISLGIGF